MPWLWRKVSNPDAGDIVVDIKASDEYELTFNLYGIYISHTATSAKKYDVVTFKEGPNETCHFFTIVIPADGPPFVIDSDEPLIQSIGAFTGYYWEHLRIITVDGGEPTLSIGVKIKGRWELVTPMYI